MVIITSRISAVVLIDTPSNLYIEDTPTTVGSQTLFYNADGGTYEQKRKLKDFTCIHRHMTALSPDVYALAFVIYIATPHNRGNSRSANSMFASGLYFAVVLANVDAEDPPVFQTIDDVSSGSKFSQTATQIGSQDSTSIQEISNDGDNSQAVQGQNIIGSTDALIDQFIRNTEEGNGSEFSQTATQIGTEGSTSGQFVDNDASNTDNSQTQLILGSTDTEVLQDIENNQVGGEDAVNIQDGELIQFLLRFNLICCDYVPF
jgi:hypothetical protein